MHGIVSCSRIEFYILNNWGDANYVGLTGICGLDDYMQEISLPVPTVISSGGRSFGEHYLVNGDNITSDERYMWIHHNASLFDGNQLILRFDLEYSISLKGLRLWNYNGGGVDGLCCGVKHCRILINGAIDIPVRVIRKATGDCSFDFGQHIPFAKDQSVTGNSHCKYIANTYG